MFHHRWLVTGNLELDEVFDQVSRKSSGGIEFILCSFPHLEHVMFNHTQTTDGVTTAPEND